MEVAHQVIRRLRCTVTVLDQTAILRHLPTADLHADRNTPATHEVQTRWFGEQIDRTLWRRATGVESDVILKDPADGIAMSGMHTLLQSRLRPTRLMQESDYRFHFLTGKAVPPLTQLLIDRVF